MTRPGDRFEISAMPFWGLLAFTFAGVSLAFGILKDHWTGMTGSMGLALVGALALPAVRKQLKADFLGVAIGIVAGLIQFALTKPSAALLFRVYPEWIGAAKTLYEWK